MGDLSSEAVPVFVGEMGECLEAQGVLSDECRLSEDIAEFPEAIFLGERLSVIHELLLGDPL